MRALVGRVGSVLGVAGAGREIGPHLKHRENKMSSFAKCSINVGDEASAVIARAFFRERRDRLLTIATDDGERNQVETTYAIRLAYVDCMARAENAVDGTAAVHSALATVLGEIMASVAIKSRDEGPQAVIAKFASGCDVVSDILSNILNRMIAETFSN